MPLRPRAIGAVSYLLDPVLKYVIDITHYGCVDSDDEAQLYISRLRVFIL